MLVSFGCLWILAAQLIAGAAILNVLTGAPRWVGALIGGGIMTIYFTAGGLLGTAWVNTLQLVVMLVGFAVALPFAVAGVGGPSAFRSAVAAVDLRRSHLLVRAGLRLDASGAHRTGVHHLARPDPEIVRRGKRARASDWAWRSTPSG